MKTGIEFIKEERERQINVEGWLPDQDDLYVEGELALASACYAIPFDYRCDFGGCSNRSYIPLYFPFADKWWKPTPNDRIKELSKAGALIAAEIDRIVRMNK